MIGTDGRTRVPAPLTNDVSGVSGGPTFINDGPGNVLREWSGTGSQFAQVSQSFTRNAWAVGA